MNSLKCDNFQWDELLCRIKRKSVIPVIGQGLYRVDIDRENKKDVRLYDYLAQELAHEYGLILPKVANHTFASATLEFLKKKPRQYIELSRFLEDAINKTSLSPLCPLIKLARINSFNIFITTAYDNFLKKLVSRTRQATVKTIAYTDKEKKAQMDINDLFDYQNNPSQILVYHILGHMSENSFPAYTESDIMETLLKLKTDREEQNKNRFFWKLQSSFLLFLGCGFDDWLSRFFIRIMSNQEFQFSAGKQFIEFVGDNFFNQKDPFHELPMFLKDHYIEVFHCNHDLEFTDRLFDKIQDRAPDDIVEPGDLITAFISFEGSDRPVAEKLVSYLKADGIDIWLDERKLYPGSEIDKTIIHTIDRVPVFIPLISENSRQVQGEDGKLKYHLREWERACGNMVSQQKKPTIIPVIIDNSNWIYDQFARFAYIKILGGEQVGDYEKLKNRLLKIQQEERNYD